MTPYQLSRQLRAVKIATDPYRPDRPQIVEHIGDAYITLDPKSDSLYPSTNWNAVYFMGCTKAVTQADIEQTTALFDNAHCPRFFFWLSPCAQEAEIRHWLLDCGLEQFGGTGYPTLLRKAEPVPDHETGLELKRLD